MNNTSHLVLVDGYAYVFRAFHALPPLTRKSDGTPIGAVSGFCNMLWKLIMDFKRENDATHFAVIFDPKGGTFRDEIYPAYKQNRPPAPPDLIPQFPLVREATEAFGLPALEMSGFEADDLIATYAKQAASKGARVTIVSSDKDLMQLITDTVLMYDPMKEKLLNAESVMEKFGVLPNRVIDIQSLMGDSTDNVPGIKGIGPKTASALINEYGTLDELLARASEVTKPKLRESLLEQADMARISRRLVTLKDDIEGLTPLDDLHFHMPESAKIIAFLHKMELTTLTKRVASQLETEIPQFTPKPFKIAIETSGEQTIDTRLAQIKAELAATSFDKQGYACVNTLEALTPWLEAAKKQGYVAFDTETSSLDAMQAELLGVSLAIAPNKACYIPLQHRAKNDLFSGGALVEGQMLLQEALEALQPLLADSSVTKIGQNIKYDMLVMKQFDIDFANIDDTMLLSYALDAGRNAHNMDDLAQIHLNHETIKYKDVTGTGKAKMNFAEVSLHEATLYAAEDADVTLRLWMLLKQRLFTEQKVTVYETLEREMPDCLSKMEERGIRINSQVLSRLSGELAQTAMRKEAEVHELAGEAFNLGSPKQIGDILFGKLGLKGGAKTKTGQWSTSASVLDDLAEEGIDIAKAILEWRSVSKLKSTYTDALPSYIHPKTGRVHTSFSLASTSTGRLASSEPNVQNIPVRTAEGRKIRTAFIAAEGCKLVSADYSQIELRLLAHIADIPQLIKAFADGVDIHAMTASEMFHVPLENMDSSVRRRAKAINFGIIYGISAFGLANQLSISREEASQYIKTYFERFPRIRDYMEDTKAFARENGYVSTIFGRHCHYPSLKTGSAAEKAFMERAAINAPIQGSAADIIRRAMVRMDDALLNAGLRAKMLLQVHDELIFDVPNSEVSATLPVIKQVMEQAPLPFLTLKVPLVVDAKAASNWDEAH